MKKQEENSRSYWENIKSISDLDDRPTEYVIKTTDPDEIKVMMDAHEMRELIERAYDEILRPHLKYGVITREQEDILEDVKEKFLRHFRNFLD